MLSYDERYADFGATAVPNRFISEYMPGAGADQLKVYLYGLMCCSYPGRDVTVESMAKALEMEPEDVRKAMRHWEFFGLVERCSDQPPSYRFIHPVWSEQTVSFRDADPVQEAFIEDLYAIFDGKRDLSGADKRKAWEWVEELRLPPEVVLILVRHLKATRGLNFAFSGKEAGRLSTMLADGHARTAEEAAELLARDEQVESGARQVIKRFNQRRQPSLDEIDLYRKWLRDWHFSSEAILEACAETTKSSSPTFAYLDRILSGIHTRAGSDDEAPNRDRQEHEKVREILDALGVRSRGVDEGTRETYRMLAGWYPHEVILFAAQECRGRGLDTLQAMLESWKNRGIATLPQAKDYVRHIHSRRSLLKQLGAIWGRSVPAGQQHMSLADRWLGEYGMSEELILHVAAWASDASAGMPYLDGILTRLHRDGITTPEEADAERARRQQEHAGAAKPAQGTARTVAAQQYSQRTYQGEAEINDLLDWLQDDHTDSGEKRQDQP